MKLINLNDGYLYPGELNINEDSLKGSKDWVYNNPEHQSVFKYNIILEVAEKYNCKNLVEFGTYIGNCPLYCYDKFNKIYTVEPVLEYFNDSKEKLNKYNNILLYNKKSLDFIKEDLNNIENEKTLIWIDDHVQLPYTQSASNDLFYVLDSLINSENIQNYILLIDDYRLWGSWYNVSNLISLLENNSSELYEKVDMVTFVPKKK